MLDIAVAYNRFKFLGDEFLTWLWFVIEQDPSILRNADPDLTSFEIGNRVVLEKKHKKAFERITIKGEDAGLEEAGKAEHRRRRGDIADVAEITLQLTKLGQAPLQAWPVQAHEEFQRVPKTLGFKT